MKCQESLNAILREERMCQRREEIMSTNETEALVVLR